MTVIAWHAATKTLAGDRMASDGNTSFKTKKVFAIDGNLVGCAGDGAGIAAFINWFESGGDAESFPSHIGIGEGMFGFTALVVNPEGELHLFECSPFPMRVLDDNFAIGSGAEVALAAMALGKNAVEAVKLACELTVSCGKGHDALVLGKSK